MRRLELRLPRRGLCPLLAMTTTVIPRERSEKWESHLVPGIRPQMRLPRRGRCPLLAMTDPGRMVFPSTPINPKSTGGGQDSSGPYNRIGFCQTNTPHSAGPELVLSGIRSMGSILFRYNTSSLTYQPKTMDEITDKP